MISGKHPPGLQDFLFDQQNVKDRPNMDAFCDWLSETIEISVYDLFFRNYISIVLLSFIILSSQSQRRSYRYIL